MGIENSSPTIQHRRVRVDEMERCRHYEYWETDFDKVQELGVCFLRYGVPLHRTFTGPDRFDWSFADVVFADLRRRKILPIVDLCHFGVPDWIGNFQNSDFPELFANYAAAFSERYDWVQLYTPVNEMYICATFSAFFGWWNEQLKSDHAFVTALKHLVKANALAMKPSIGSGSNGRMCCGSAMTGVPVVGFTWYSLTDQIDWDTALRENNGRANPLGLYDLNRNIRRVGKAYKQLIADWRHVLPTQSVCLRVPVASPEDQKVHGGEEREQDVSSEFPTAPAVANAVRH